MEDGFYGLTFPNLRGSRNLGIWVGGTDDDVIPLVASSAGLPGFLGEGGPILPISLSTSKGWDVSLAGMRGLMMSFSCLFGINFSSFFFVFNYDASPKIDNATLSSHFQTKEFSDHPDLQLSGQVSFLIRNSFNLLHKTSAEDTVYCRYKY